MIREGAKNVLEQLDIFDYGLYGTLNKVYELIDQIYDEHEAELKAKDEEIERLKAKLEELDKLGAEIFMVDLLHGKDYKARSIVAMLFWEWRKDKRIYENANKFTKKTAELYVNCSELSFRKAQKILKDNA